MCRASVGRCAPPLGCRLDVSSGFSGECVRTGQVLWCDDTETDPRVDPETCRGLGIRSILAAPIVQGRNVIGLLEVFSPEPSAFDDGCIAIVQRLAQNALPAPPPAPRPAPPKLLIEREPWYRVFLRNLGDTLFPPRLAPLKLTSLPARFWADVFVPSRMPWERLLQSMLLHAIMIAAVMGGMEFWQFQGTTVRRRGFNKSDVLYYSPEEYLRAMATGGSPSREQWRGPALGRPASLVVSREPDRRAPDVVLKPDGLSSSLLAWNSLAPIQPLTTASARSGPRLSLLAAVGPPPEVRQASGIRFVTGLSPAGVIGPPPEISAVSRGRVMTVALTGIVGPPPSLRGFVRRAGAVEMGQPEAVGPAPRIPSRELATSAGIALAALHGSVVPPPPSVSGSGNSGRRVRTALAVATPVAPPPAMIRAASSPNPAAGPTVRDTHAGEAPPSPVARDPESPANSKELSVNFVGLALTLGSSSYFSSREVFIAEDRVRHGGSRLIKLVYEFLPYQPRLSDYGPNYPAVDKLRVTRDPNCDEPLRQVMSSARPFSDQLQQDLQGSNWQARTLECYRTTAEDYRRAREHH